MNVANKERFILLHAGAEFMEDFKQNSSFDLTLVNPVLASIWLRALRRLHLKCTTLFNYIWIKQYLDMAQIKDDGSEMIIVFDTDVWLKNIKYITKKFPNTKVVTWYWNIVKDDKLVALNKGFASKVCTFDPADSKKYEIELHNQFYWLKPEVDNKKLDFNFDVVFVGRIKGRLKTLERIYEVLSESGLRVYFYVVKDHSEDSSVVLDLKSEFMPYFQVCKLIEQSKSILDLLQPGQEGMTLRSLESIFWGKKLITDNSLVKKEAFFISENTLFVDKLISDPQLLLNFANSRPIKVPNITLSKYTLDTWLLSMKVG
jgi:hypothetical protein